MCLKNIYGLFLNVVKCQTTVNNHLCSAGQLSLLFLLLSYPRVSQSVDTKMDVNNLARVFGPTLVGHAVPDPDPMTILHDTNRQPRVM